jgi:hypothetical protein
MKEKSTYTFGNSRSFRATRYSVLRNTRGPDFAPPFMQLVDTVFLARPDISRDNYYQALEDINRSFTVVADPEDDSKVFEIGRANLDAPLENGIDAEISTFTSSLSGNLGNAVEFAENAALHPDRQRIYIASLGNGRSSYWTDEEQRHIRETGRFTYSVGEPLPTLKSLARALNSSDFKVTRFSTNSMGGAHATGLMAALPEGQVTHAYLKSRPNISHHPAKIAWGAAIVIGDALDDKKLDKASRDPWKLTGEMIEDAEEKLPNLYSEAAENRYKTFADKAASSHAFRKMLTDLTALSRGDGQPAAVDTVRALQQQPEALITHHLPLADRLYKDLPAEAIRYLLTTYALGGAAVANIASGQIEALIMPGAHRDHTKYPHLRWATENYSFGRRL